MGEDLQYERTENGRRIAKVRKSGDGFILNSGRVVYAINGTIGINNKLQMTYGWDGALRPQGDATSGDRFTRSEKTEIADYMIALWTRVKTKNTK